MMPAHSINTPKSIEKHLVQGIVGGCLIGFNSAMLVINWVGIHSVVGGFANTVGLICACVLVNRSFQRTERASNEVG